MIKKTEKLNWFATTPLAMEGLLAEEIKELGGLSVKESQAGVSFTASLEVAYRVIVWSRLTSRLLLQLHSFEASSSEMLYRAIYNIDWKNHFSTDMTFVVRSSAKGSQLHQSEYVNQVVKDAIVDQFRKHQGTRPSIDRKEPDIAIHCRIVRNMATVSIEMADEVLHRRGYRMQQGMAPLRENVAAAMLMRSGWFKQFEPGSAFVDPMCGSGTLVIEAALIAANIAPRIIPGAASLNKWLQHDQEIWDKHIQDAKEKRSRGLENSPELFGYDHDERVVEFARRNAARAQVEHMIQFKQSSYGDIPAPSSKTGLIAVNPPYGKRLLNEEQLYSGLGQLWARQFQGWKAIMITDERFKARTVGLRAQKINTIYNGGLECILAQYDLTSDNEYRAYDPGVGKNHGLTPKVKAYSQEAVAFENRLRKNIRKLKSWLKKTQITCYRLYDADMPNFALAVDVYEGKNIVVQEYAPPASIDLTKANDRLHEALAMIAKVLNVSQEQIHLKQRRRQKGKKQYDKMDQKGVFEEVQENGLNFLVNFTDYLDTGLFLDHRPVRQMIRDMSKGKRFLNLFSYTGSATVYSIAGGAMATTSIDASNTYVGWMESNLRRNNMLARRHQLIRGDCIDWLKVDHSKYDLVFCDPPTRSVSSDRRKFDIQNDHRFLIRLVMEHLYPGGTLIFSTNFRKFKMSKQILESYNVKEITRETIPRDFEKNGRIHKCWTISAVE